MDDKDKIFDDLDSDDEEYLDKLKTTKTGIVGRVEKFVNNSVENISNIVVKNKKGDTATKTLKNPKSKYQSYSKKRFIGTSICYAILTVLAIIWVIPFVWMVLQAFSNNTNEAGLYSGFISSNFFPSSLGFQAFKNLFTTSSQVQFGKWFFNTLVVAIASSVLSCVIVLSTAYVLSKVKFKGRKLIINMAMILGLFPGFMSIIVIYFIIRVLGLGESLFALILCYSAASGLGFYVAKGFFDIIPNSLIESARLDGASNLTTFTQIILPMSKPIIIYTVLTSFTGPWMDYIFARVILGSENVEIHTVAVGLYFMLFGGQGGRPELFTTFVAGCILVAVPITLLFVFLQKYYVGGVTAGAVKG